MTSILQFADIHFGVEDRAALTAIDAIIDRLAPDVSVISGDITQSGSKTEFEAASNWLSSLSGPKIITAGNHDTPMYGILDRLIKPFDRYDDYIAPHDIGVFEDENVIIQSMNTARGVQMKLDWSLGVVNIEELDRKIARFAECDRAKLRLLNVHHPFIYPPEAPLQKDTQNGPAGLKRLADGHCDAVLSGHVHIPFVVEREPGGSELLSISAGTLSTRRRGNNPSFNHIQIDADDISLTMIEFTDGAYVRSETFRKKRNELSAWRRGEQVAMRTDAAVLNTQE